MGGPFLLWEKKFYSLILADAGIGRLPPVVSAALLRSLLVRLGSVYRHRRWFRFVVTPVLRWRLLVDLVEHLADFFAGCVWRAVGKVGASPKWTTRSCIRCSTVLAHLTVHCGAVVIGVARRPVEHAAGRRSLVRIASHIGDVAIIESDARTFCVEGRSQKLKLDEAIYKKISQRRGKFWFFCFARLQQTQRSVENLNCNTQKRFFLHLHFSHSLERRPPINRRGGLDVTEWKKSFLGKLSQNDEKMIFHQFGGLSS